MAEYLIKEESIVAIADAIRNKTGKNTELTLGEMVSGINSIVSSGGINTSDATIVSGNQMLSGVTAYGANGKITGSIPSQGANTIMPNNNSQVAISAGTYAAGDITVEAVPTEVKDITVNGTYTPQSGKYFSSVSVNIPSGSFDTQSKTIAPTESNQVVTPDNGYDGLSSVTVEAIPSDYVGSSIVRERAKIITPTKSTQTAITSGTYIEGDITVGAIPSEYIITTDADASEECIMSGKTAYVNGEKITGSFTIDDEITAQDTVIAQIQSALEGKAMSSEKVQITLSSSGSAGYVSMYVTNKTPYSYTKAADFTPEDKTFEVDKNSMFIVRLYNNEPLKVDEYGFVISERAEGWILIHEEGYDDWWAKILTENEHIST